MKSTKRIAWVVFFMLTIPISRSFAQADEMGNLFRDFEARDAAGTPRDIAEADPALERLETRRLPAEKVSGLFEAEPAGVDDEMVEMAVVQRRRPGAACLRGHGARPQALELIDAERAGLGRRRQRYQAGRRRNIR